jgi:cerevisin
MSSYIVSLHPHISREAFLQLFSPTLGPNSSIVHEFEHVLNGFSGIFTERELEFLRAHRDVKIVEKDGIILPFDSDSQNDAPWGLGRTCRHAPLESTDDTSLTYFYHWDKKAGSGVDIYIVDTGIDTTHADFEGRASWGTTKYGKDKVDKDGHGTHVAGTAISKHYGVAKAANAIAVKVLEDGEGSTSALISGLDWVISNVKVTTRPSVVNLSLGGSVSASVDTAVQSVIAALIPVVAAAGNDNYDARTTSPACSPGAITVGACNIHDTKCTFSNWGKDVNVWAPGENIISTCPGGGTNTLDGTSMATPHVSGLLAYLISLDTITVPENFWVYAHVGILNEIPFGTANRLAYNNHQDDNDYLNDLYDINWEEPVTIQSEPSDRIRGGVESSGSLCYVGHADYNPTSAYFGTFPGEFRESTGKFYITYNGNEVTSDNYQLLFGSQIISQWIRVKGSLDLFNLAGYRAVAGGTETTIGTDETTTEQLYIIQGFYKDEVHCGRVKEGDVGLIPYNGSEINLNIYNVLVWKSSQPPICNFIGRYMTMLNDWSSIQQGNTFTRRIPITAAIAPRVVVGLNYIDTSYPDSDHAGRVHAYVDDINSNSFTAHIDASSTSKLYNGGMSWLQLATTDPDFQCGIFYATGVTAETISFNWRFDDTPVVFVGLSGFDISDNPRIRVYPSDITKTDFKLNVDNLGGSTTINKCWATWVAFPEAKEGIYYGTISSDKTTTSSSYEGSSIFWKKFKHSPKIFTAFTKFDVDREQPLRMRLDVENVSVDGMDWQISTWGGSRLYSVEAAFIALDG